MSKEKASLPQLPGLAQLGLTTPKREKQPRPFASDGTKKVAYSATRPQNTRPFQSRALPSSVKPYPDLTITPHGEAISYYIQQNPIIAVDAPTGTGKTRYLPYLMATKGFKVRVSIPTTVAVRNAYKFQRDYSRLRVGYAAGREIQYSEKDQLVYATTGHFTQKILGTVKSGRNVMKEVRDVFGDILFIDEVHTSTSQITLLIGLIRHLFNERGQYNGPKIVFASATFNHGDIMDHFKDFPVYRVSIESKPVQVNFLPPTTKYDQIKDDPNPYIIQYIQNELERWQQQGGIPYHGIVFRPGVVEVEETIEKISRAFPDAPIDFLPAYSDLTPAELDQIFIETNRMKVIVGTPIIESSITVSDVGFVIDDMLEKIAETSATGGNKLTLTLISKAASEQRKGRTGRTIPGRDYKLITEKKFEELEPYRKREIDRVPIYSIILQLIDAGLSPRSILKINIPRYDQARRVLLQLGMISVSGNHYTVTPVGRFVSSVPLGIHNAYMIYLGFNRFKNAAQQQSQLSAEKILLRTVIAVACMIETYGPSYFYVPRRGREETMTEYNARKDAHIEEYHEKFRGATDIHTFANIFWQMMSDIDVARKYDMRTRHHFMNYVLEWSNNNQMNHKKIKEFLSAMREVESIVESKIQREVSLRTVSPESGKAEILPRGRLGKHGFSIGRDLPDGGYVVLGNIVAPIFAQAYHMNKFVQDRDRRGKIVYLDKRTGIQYMINRRASFNEIVVTNREGPLTIVAAQTVEVVGKQGAIHLAGIFVPETYIPQEKQIAPIVQHEDSRVKNRVNDFAALWEKIPDGKLQIASYADIGSGQGDIGKAIGKYLDLDRSAIHLLDIESAHEIEVIQDDQIPLPNRSIGLVTAFVSIHHFTNPVQMLMEIQRITISQGYFYLRDHNVTTPAQAHYINWIHLLDMVNRDENELDQYYTAFYSYQQLANYLQTLGYTPVEVQQLPEPNPQKLYNALFQLNQNAGPLRPPPTPIVLSIGQSVE
jgi:HrpA-like RNA helicase/SAM-dependent methyltransferase